MADNYIEKQYEQYLKRKAEWEKSRKRKSKKTIVPKENKSPETPQSNT